ncbi:hypothetical protein HYPSUDRAFT_180619, partial [Hypholoma sublateritium FD-334 SS-4]
MAPKPSTTTAADPRTIHFDPLDETNYHYWAMRMEAELIRRDLWSVIVCEDDLTLAGIHVARGLATRLALRRSFLRLVKDEAETMSAWVGRVKRMAFQLVAIGVVVSDEDRILALTNGLDDTYEAFVISLDSTHPKNLTLDYVVDRLLNDEMRRGNKGKDEED